MLVSEAAAVAAASTAVARHTVVSNGENPHKISSHRCDFTNFSNQFSEDSHDFRFRLCIRFKINIRQTIDGIRVDFIL